MRILLVVDQLDKKSSGGKVVEYLQEFFQKKEIQHFIIIPAKEKIDLNNSYRLKGNNKFPLQPLNEIYNYVNKKRLKKIIKTFRPSLAHFASFDSAKPHYLIEILNRNRIPIIMQPWIYDFYCAQHYGYKNGIDCNSCLVNGFKSAITEKCLKPYRYYDIFKRYRLKNTLTSETIFLSSHESMDKKLIKYGVADKNIKRCPVPFKPLKPIRGNEEAFYAVFGQNLEFKGFKAIINEFKKFPKRILKVFIIGDYDEDLTEFPNIQIFKDVTRETGLFKELNKATAIIIPSIWETTGEYSLFESLSLNKIVILTDIGFHRSLKNLSNDIYTIDINSLEQLDSILNKIEEYKIRRNKGPTSRDVILHQSEYFEKNLLKIYNDLVISNTP